MAMGACVYAMMKSICMVCHLFNVATTRNRRIVDHETTGLFVSSKFSPYCIQCHPRSLPYLELIAQLLIADCNFLGVDHEGHFA
jgi:formate-dependent nitrite reductase cytochrome c552 subunit